MLRRDQYRQATEWEYGPQPENTDWARLTRDLEQPNWINYAVYYKNHFCAAVSLECVNSKIVRFHVAKQPKTINPFELADLLIRMADWLLRIGFDEIEAVIPFGYRPSRRLAIRTGMTYRGNVQNGERFSITKDEYQRLYHE